MNRKIFTGLVWALLSSPLWLVLALLLLLTLPAEASQPGVSITPNCRDLYHAEVTVTVSAAVDYLAIFDPLHYAPIYLIWPPENNRAQTRRVDIPFAPPENPTNDPDIQYIIDHWLIETQVYFYVNSMTSTEPYNYMVTLPFGLPNCNGSSAQTSASTMSVPQVPMNECIPQPHVMSGAGTFVVDDVSYAYDQNLSWIVPASAVWRWEIYIDGQLYLTVEQTADTPCHIV